MRARIETSDLGKVLRENGDGTVIEVYRSLVHLYLQIDADALKVELEENPPAARVVLEQDAMGEDLVTLGVRALKGELDHTEHTVTDGPGDLHLTSAVLATVNYEITKFIHDNGPAGLGDVAEICARILKALAG